MKTKKKVKIGYHPKVDDIWYRQFLTQRIEFYQVTQVKGTSTIVLRQVDSELKKRIAHGGNDFLNTVVPKPHSFSLPSKTNLSEKLLLTKRIIDGGLSDAWYYSWNLYNGEELTAWELFN